jgi:putative aldouronate transport system substrate-binding protein
MKSKKIKALCSIIAVTMLLGLTSGCKSANKEGEKSTTGTEQKEDKKDGLSKYAPIKDKKYTIQWLAGSLAPVEDNAELIKYWNEKFNVDIKVWNIDGAKWDELLNLKFASGEVPDKVEIRGFSNLQKYYDQDLLAGVDLEVIKKYAPKLYNTFEKDIPGMFKYGSIDGKQYGIPTYNEDSRYRRAIVWREDWLKNVGINKIPETLAEYEDALYKFRNNDPDKNGKKDTYGLSTSAIYNIYGAFGYINEFWGKKDNKLVYSAVQPEMKEALKLLSKWYKDGIIDPEFITGENKGGYFAISHAFVNGRIGLTSHGLYYHWRSRMDDKDTSIIGHNIVEMEKTKEGSSKNIAFGLPPVGPNGKRGAVQANSVDSTLHGFGKHLEKEPDKIGKILEIYDYLMGSFDNYLAGRQGFEGKQWEKQNGVPTRIGKFVDGKELSKIGGMGIMNISQPYDFALQLDPYKAKWAEGKNLDKYGIREELLAPLPSQGKYQTELDKIRSEAYIAIITGDKPIEYFDEFVAKWKKAGGEALEKEANEWYSKLSK